MSRHNAAEMVWSWAPTKCESCGEQFNQKWQRDFSLSGELIWMCGKCGHWMYPEIPDLDCARPLKPIGARARHG
jgi:hypothetical protein